MGFFSRGTSTGRRVPVILALALFLVLLVSGTGFAQTTLVTNPTTLVFTPSADHDTVLSDGRAAVDYYSFDVYAVGASQPFQRTNIGKPARSSDGNIYYDFSSTVVGWPLPGGNYEARVVAVGPNGSAPSTPSNQFTFSSCSYTLSGASASMPAAGGGTQVSVTTQTGCTWTATSNVSWTTLSPTSGTGNGTVVATVAANTSTSSRTATLTVAGNTFTINQAGATATATPPSAPSSPSPASGATGVSTAPTLTWSASGATSYTISFGTTNPPPQRATGLTTASYAPGSLSASTTYYWRIVAANTSGSTTGPVWSFTTAAGSSTPTSPSPVPSPWRNQDIGVVGLAGSASVSGSTFTVTGSGADIWGSSDAFHFVSQPVSGDVEVVARMTGQQNTNYYAKAGLMLRADLTSNAPHVILDVLPGGGIEFMTRASTGSSTTVVGTATQNAPAWLKLTRNGNTVTGAVSADGVTWRTVGSTTVSIGASAQAGLAVTSHDTTLRNTATFDNVKVTAGAATTGLPSGWSNRDVGTVGIAGSTSYASGTFTVAGAGGDIWGNTDAFHFAYRSLPGDGEIVARVTSLRNTHPHAKASVMLRSALSADAAHVMLDVEPNGNIEFMKRSSTGGNTTFLAGATQSPPSWLRLTRTGTTVTGAVSADGVTWRTVGSTSVSFGAASVGLAVTSHTTGALNTATFDNVVVR